MSSGCGTGAQAVVASAGPHFGEEPPLVGRGGSGTIFLAGCNLRCVFCQNADISQGTSGDERTAGEIATLAMSLQNWGCHNINFVTPEHVVPQVIEAIVAAVPAGLRLPIVYNTSAYDSLRSLAMLDGLVDIYMPDFKLWTPALAKRLCDAEDYPERARAALQEMHRQVGALRFGPDELAKRGVLVTPALVVDGRVRMGTGDGKRGLDSASGRGSRGRDRHVARPHGRHPDRRLHIRSLVVQLLGSPGARDRDGFHGRRPRRLPGAGGAAL